MRVLVVEDDRGVAVSLTDGLSDAGYEVDHVATGAAALDVEAERDVDVVLLDLGLPDMDGRDVCRELRSRSSNVPIIMLTARGDEFDRVLGLELGADDYVTKPFSVRELIARIRAVTRRTAANDVGDNGDPQTIGPLTIDRRSRRVTMGDGPVNLTAKEFDLLAFLATDPGAVQIAHRDPRPRVGHQLVRPHEDRRRPRRRGPQEARRCPLDRGRARRRVPVRGAARVRWRLVAVLVGIVVLVLAAQNIPLARHLRSVERTG